MNIFQRSIGDSTNKIKFTCLYHPVFNFCLDFNLVAKIQKSAKWIKNTLKSIKYVKTKVCLTYCLEK